MLWLFASIFFFGTIIMTRKSNTPPWKSSVIALLRPQDQHGAPNSMKHIKQDAREIEVQLTYREDARRLYKVNLDAPNEG